MNVLLIGPNGFIGKNIRLKLQEEKVNFFEVTRKTSKKNLKLLCSKVDVIIHCAGQNVSKLKSDFIKNNILITDQICKILSELNKKPKIIYLSTIKINEKTTYGITKKKTEEVLLKFSKKNNSTINILRLPNVYGKWCKPNYNSFVTTILFNIPRGIKFGKVEFKNKIKLVHVDNVVSKIFNLIKKNVSEKILRFKPEKIIKIEELLNLVNNMWFCHKNGFLYDYKSNFERKLYSSFLSYLPHKNYIRSIKKFEDKRGVFAEIFKNKKYGQISFFSINPGEIRGRHYHKLKNEKFIILSGSVQFRMKCLNTQKYISKKIYENNIEEIISVPGWSHEVKNIGKKKAIILLWSNEIYDNKNPDTYHKPV